MTEKASDIIKRLQKEGWEFKESRGSHRHFVHPEKPGKVTVPAGGGADIRIGTLKSIYKQAGWRWPPR